MDTQSQKFKVRLGLFIAGGLALFILASFHDREAEKFI